jgi:hypothetical protein
LQKVLFSESFIKGFVKIMSSSAANASSNVQLDALSVYIPYVYTNVSKETIADAFQKANVGVVGKVDFVVKKDTKTNRDYHNCYVHFTEWSSSDYANQVRAAVESGEPIKLFYTLPAKGRRGEQHFFWTILKNTYVKKTEQQQEPIVQASYVPTTPPGSPPATSQTITRKAPAMKREDSLSAADFEEIATDADVEPGFFPSPSIDLVATDYVERMEQQCGQYRMQIFQQENHIQALTQQLQFYMQKSFALENNLGVIEQQMRQEMEDEIETIRQAFEELEVFGEDEEGEEKETEVVVSSTV